MLRNQKDKLAFGQVLAPQAVSASVASSGVELSELMSLAFFVNVSAFTFTGSNKIKLQVQESDDNSTYTDVSLSDQYLSAVKELTTAGDGAKCHLAEYRGIKKYARINLVVSGTVSPNIGVTYVSMHPTKSPAQ